VEDRRSIAVVLKWEKHPCELKSGSGVLIQGHFLLKMLYGFKNGGAQGKWISGMQGTCACENSLW